MIKDIEKMIALTNGCVKEHIVGFLLLFLSAPLLQQSALANEPVSENQTAKIIGGTPVPRIIGGAVAKRFDWPWMVALVNAGRSPELGQFCGATLVDREWILTAAHCVEFESPQDVQALIGESWLSIGETFAGELIDIEQIVVHPDFNPFSLDSDLALLKLTSASMHNPIQTIGRFSKQNEAGKIATALGWGNISTYLNIFPDSLHQVEVPLIANSLCATTLDITTNMICAGFEEGGKDTCQGDSGGPLIVFDSESQTWRQVGITSFGSIFCAAAGQYGAYTRLEMFSDFISATTCSISEIPETPELKIAIKDRIVTASWSASNVADGYRLNYAPYPAMDPISSIDMQQNTSFSVPLNKDDAFFVAINAYNGNCRSAYSNIEDFIVP